MTANNSGEAKPETAGSPRSSDASRYQLLVENSHDMMSEFTLDGTYLYANPAHEVVLGYRPEELVGKNAFTLVHPDDQEKAAQYIQEQRHRGTIRYRHKDGKWRWLDCTGSIFPINGEPRMVITGRDITDLVQAQHKLGVLAGLARVLGSVETFEQAARVVARAASDLCGWDAFSLDMYSSEENRVNPILTIDTVNGQHIEVPHGYTGTEPSGLFQRVLAEGSMLILRPQARFDGDAVPFGASMKPSRSLIFVPIIEQGKTIGIASAQSYQPDAYSEEDLKLMESLADHCASTFARLTAREASREAQSWFQTFMEINPAAVSIKDEQGRYLYVNRTVERVTGQPFGQWVGKTDPEMLPEGIAQELLANDQVVLANGAACDFEADFQMKDGQRHHWHVWKFPLESGSGKRCIGAMAFDVREREEAREALLQSEAKFRSVFQEAPLAISIGRNGILNYVNKAFLDMFGLRDEREAVGKHPADFLSTSARPDLQARMRRRANQPTMLETYETTSLRADGREFPLEVNVAQVQLPEGLSQVGFMVDLTQRKTLENQLLHSQKLESIGRLAGGVAHDFNNLLTVIKGYASLLDASSLAPDQQEAVEQISTAAGKAAALTTQLLAFSRKQVVQLRTIDLNQAVQQMTRMLSRVLGEDIELDMALDSALPQVRADAGMLDQVLMNLAVNARDAMPQGGSLRISTRVVTAESEPGLSQEFSSGRAVCLEVCDTGCGIPEEHLSKIFEPFFTTKEIGAGTGLGLATVYGIVKQHSGAVTVTSRLGKGTLFRIFLPAIAQVGSNGERLPSGGTASSGKGETVLVVEDDLAIRNLVRLGLRRAGYDVIEAADAAEGLARFKAANSRIALVLTDVVMPGGISGKDLASQIRAVSPHSKIIFTSGYAPGAGKDGFTLGPEDTFLAKPYKLQDLLNVIRRKIEGELR